LFAVVGRKKGVIAFLVLWGALVVLSVSLDAFGKRQMRIAKQFISDQCFAQAGTRIQSALPEVPRQIVIRADPGLRPGAQNSLGTYIPDQGLGSHVSRVHQFPEPRQSDAAYVDIVKFQESIDGGGHWWFQGLRTTVTDWRGRVIATQIDVARGSSWCLGEDPPASIDKFLEGALGRPVGFIRASESATRRRPVYSPLGTTGKLQSGRFDEGAHERLEGMDAARQKMAQLPPVAECVLRDDARGRAAYCLDGTTDENVIELGAIAAIHILSDSWLTILRGTSDTDNLDSLTMVERSMRGAVLQTWHVRFPRIENPERGNRFVVRNVASNGRRITIEMLVHSNFSLDDGPDRPVRRWHENKLEVSADLELPLLRRAS
jgi:hypothetical protein